MGIKERGVIPPQRVEVRVDGRWIRGDLDRWSREEDGWYGQVRLDLNGIHRWFRYPTDLRKA